MDWPRLKKNFKSSLDTERILKIVERKLVVGNRFPRQKSDFGGAKIGKNRFFYENHL